MINLYYVIEYETSPGEGFYDDLTGVKYITCYIIVRGGIKDTLEELYSDAIPNTSNSKERIIDWLNSNNYDIDDWEIIKL